MATKNKNGWLKVGCSSRRWKSISWLKNDFYGEQNKNGWLNQKQKEKYFSWLKNFMAKKKKKVGLTKKAKRKVFTIAGALYEKLVARA